MRPAMARLTLARKMAAIVLRIWKKGERFDPGILKQRYAPHIRYTILLEVLMLGQFRLA
jgi:hypothetical protein